jgi:hypothetical protein
MPRIFVVEVITSPIQGLDCSYPSFPDEEIRRLTDAKKELEEG